MLRHAAVLAAVIGALCGASIAAAAEPPATTAQETPRVTPSTCPVLADVAMKSAVFADEKIPRKQAERLLQRLYRWSGDGGDLVVAMVLDRAYASPLVRGTAEKFTARVLLLCTLRGGDLEAIMGRGV